jgi:diguanylate cyclase (GGDEF)-like protein
MQKKSLRTKQVIDISMVGIMAGILMRIIQGNGLSVLILIVSVIVLIFARRLASDGQETRAFSIMAWALAISMSYTTWTYNGLRDPSLLSYPAILLMISMVGRKDLMIKVFSFFTVSLFLLCTFNHYGIYTNSIEPASFYTLAQIMIILSVSTIVIWAINSDYFKSFQSLKETHLDVLADQERIEFIANHDSLTGLPTRALARDLFEEMIFISEATGQQCSLLFLDLDNFKAINDSMGHRAGDLYLQRVADVLKKVVSERGTACRQSGDEFLILLENVQNNDHIEAITRDVLEGLHVPFDIEQMPLSASCSIGIAVYPRDGTTYDELFKNADTAMYKAKEAGRNGFCFFDQQSHSRVKQNIHLMSGLRNAIASNELVLHYQPQFDLITQQMIGAEALVRWNHPTEGMLPPLSFIHLAETSGLINDLGNWVLNEACRQNASWRKQGLDLVMSINLSPMQFRRDDLDRTILSALSDSGLPGTSLELELTESLFVDDTDKVCEMLGRINAMGVQMSIDDFGTGYSNLSYLRRLPVQQLKIDQSFVRNMDHDNQALINVIIQMSENFRLTSIAEGIEDEETMLKLRAMGCERGQGYYWDKPLPAAVFESKYIKKASNMAA